MTSPERLDNRGAINKLDQVFKAKLLSGDLTLTPDGNAETLEAVNSFGQALTITRPSISVEQQTYQTTGLRYILEVKTALTEDSPEKEFRIVLSDKDAPLLVTDTDQYVGPIDDTGYLELLLTGVVL